MNENERENLGLFSLYFMLKQHTFNIEMMVDE